MTGKSFINSAFAFSKKGWRWPALVSALALSLILVGGLFSGCVTGDNGDNGNNITQHTFPMTITDDLGREVTITSAPQTIVSLSPGNTEIVYALGLEDKLVGVTDFCDYPVAALDKPKVGGFSTVEIEQVISINPDIILASNIHEDEVVPQLENLGLTVVVFSPEKLEEVFEAMLLIGQIMGVADTAGDLVDSLQVRVDAVTDKMANLTEGEKPTVFYIVWHDPLMTVGPDTRIYQLIELAGGKNAVFGLADGYPAISLEVLVAVNPQFILAGTGMGSGADSPLNFALEDSRLADIYARVNGQIYSVNTDLTGRPGPRMVDALEAIAELLHPELFS